MRTLSYCYYTGWAESIIISDEFHYALLSLVPIWSWGVLELYSICAVFIQYLLICIYDDLELHMWSRARESAREPMVRSVCDATSSLWRSLRASWTWVVDTSHYIETTRETTTPSIVVVYYCPVPIHGLSDILLINSLLDTLLLSSWRAPPGTHIFVCFLYAILCSPLTNSSVCIDDGQ